MESIQSRNVKNLKFGKTGETLMISQPFVAAGLGLSILIIGYISGIVLIWQNIQAAARTKYIVPFITVMFGVALSVLSAKYGVEFAAWVRGGTFPVFTSATAESLAAYYGQRLFARLSFGAAAVLVLLILVGQPDPIRFRSGGSRRGRGGLDTSGLR